MKTLRNQETVLENLDRFDIRQYEEILQQSQLFRNMETEGSKILPSFPSLQRDLWGGMYKYEPAMKGKVEKDLYINKEIMQRILDNPEFQGFREYTKLDELASALGCVNMSEKINDVIKYVDAEQEKAQKEMKRRQEQANERREEANNIQQLLDQLQKQLQEAQQQESDQQGNQQGQDQDSGQDSSQGENNQQSQSNNGQQQQMQQEIDQLQQEAQAAEQAAQKAERQAKKAQKTMETAIEQAMQSNTFNQKIGNAIQQAQENTEAEKQDVTLLMGGQKAGTDAGRNQGNLIQNLRLVEELRKNKTLKKTLDLAGKMQFIALKKQKEKVTDTTQKSEVELGNSPERLLPSELLLYNNPDTRMIFMKRFAEGETLQYGTTEKEKAGKGPVIACIDISGSMDEYIDGTNKRCEWAKAVAFALWIIAQRQKRPFYCIEFDNDVQESYKVTKDNVTYLLKAKSSGGTSFYPPLAEAFKVMKRETTFKKSDIIFITDGNSSVKHLDEVLLEKKNTKTSVFSIQLSSSDTQSLEQFSDQVTRYDPNSHDFERIFEI